MTARCTPRSTRTTSRCRRASARRAKPRPPIVTASHRSIWPRSRERDHDPAPDRRGRRRKLRGRRRRDGAMTAARTESLGASALSSVAPGWTPASQVPADGADDRGGREEITTRGRRRIAGGWRMPNGQTRKGPVSAFVLPCKGTGWVRKGVGITAAVYPIVAGAPK